QRGTTLLLIEQNAAKALAVANRGYVLETGRVVKEGTARALLESPDVQRAYLGISSGVHPDLCPRVGGLAGGGLRAGGMRHFLCAVWPGTCAADARGPRPA